MKTLKKLSNVMCKPIYFILIFYFIFFKVSVFAETAQLKGIFLDGNSSEIRLQMSEKIHGKIIMVDKKEVLIALKNITLSDGAAGLNQSNDLIRKIEVDELPGNVLSIVVTGKVPFKSVNHAWDKQGLNLTVKFNEEASNDKTKSNTSKNKNDVKVSKTKNSKSSKYKSDTTQPAQSDKKKEKEDKQNIEANPVKPASASNKDDSVKIEDAGADVQKNSSGKIEESTINENQKKKVYGTRKNRLSETAGDISDIVLAADLRDCKDNDLKKAYLLIKQSDWKNSYDLLNSYIEKGGTECVEKAEFLRAYTFYQSADTGDLKQMLEAEALFHDLIINRSSSPLLPFAYSSLGLIYYLLDNPASSEGYFTIAADEYKNYLGLPEVLYYLGKLYDERSNVDKEYNDRAIEKYREVFDKYSDSVYAVDAGVGLGKALFKKLSYIESRDILTALVESNPEIIYESSDVLRSLGEAEYALQNTIPARENLTKLYNFFPNINDKDMVMTKVGDTYYHEKNLDKAKAVYQFVMDKFPGTDGFLNSAMGLALCLTERDKIEEIYNMVKENFGDNMLSKVAMMRLAELYNKNGEYEKCIAEIETLLATHPTGLRYDASKLMQSAYESLFRKKLKEGAYTDVLTIYEGAKVLLDRLDSREIFLTTGLAYLKAALYDQAFNQLMESYKQFSQNERPAELLFALGIAMDESVRDHEAINIFKAFIDKSKDGPEKVEAYQRIGNILFDEGELTKASKNFQAAYGISKDRVVRGGILIRDAEVYQRLNQWNKSSELIEKAITEYASATGQNYELLSSAYKALGKSYLEHKLFVKAAESFTTALKISDTGKIKSVVDIEFMLGDAYQKANAVEKAKKTFEKVAGSDDSIWSRLAKERLTTLALAEKVSSS